MPSRFPVLGETVAGLLAQIGAVAGAECLEALTEMARHRAAFAKCNVDQVGIYYLLGRELLDGERLEPDCLSVVMCDQREARIARPRKSAVEARSRADDVAIEQVIGQQDRGQRRALGCAGHQPFSCRGSQRPSVRSSGKMARAVE
ncbi:hypothetical protein ASG72_19535 [Bosea sp. Leaf344]|nr:hypothetical protein ASG72_19535 [Bosea sp. Leaf344]